MEALISFSRDEGFLAEREEDGDLSTIGPGTAFPPRGITERGRVARCLNRTDGSREIMTECSRTLGFKTGMSSTAVFAAKHRGSLGGRSSRLLKLYAFLLLLPECQIIIKRRLN